MSQDNKIQSLIEAGPSNNFHEQHEDLTDVIYNNPEMLPHRYVFILTNLCNLRCSFCFQKKDRRPDSMTTKDWLEIAEQLPSYSRVTLTGGEPLVFSGFEEVFSYVAQRFSCNLITNGLLLTEEIADFLLSFPKFRALSISIDNINNTLRDVNPQQWAHAEDMMRYFIRRRNETRQDCTMEAKTVVLDENAEDLLEIHRYCVEDLGCDHHSFQFLKGSPTQHADYMFDFDAILKKSHAPTYKKFDIIQSQLELVRQYNLRSQKVAFLHPPMGSLVSAEPLADLGLLNKPEHIKENYLPCKFPWSSVHINVDGELFPCMAVPMGNVKKMRLDDIIHGEEFTKFRDLLKKEGTIEGCNRCGWLRQIEQI